MKTSDLMIEDWVDSPYGYMQVKFIYNNGYDDVVGEHEEMYLDWDTGEEDPRMKDITIGMVEPLPLTEEIVKINNLSYSRKAFEYDEWEITITKNPTCFTVDIAHTIDDGYDYSLDCFPIRYVHELQHILRLCGLRDLADNFKVE